MQDGKAGPGNEAGHAEHLQTCGLELHPEKTKLVYCKDDLRKKTYSNEKFDFLGYTFQPRRSKNRKGKYFINFSPTVSNKAAKAIRDTFRSWKLPKRSDKAIEDLSRMFNPIIRGWLQYYGRYYPSALYPTISELDRDLALWAKRKYKKLRPPSPPGDTLAHTPLASGSRVVCPLADGGAAGLHAGSCMSQEAHVQFCERPGVGLPGRLTWW